MGDNGFIKVHRKMKDSKVWYYTDSQFKVWITILMECNWKKAWGRFQGEEVKVNPGQLLTSRKHLADCSGVGKNTVRKTLTKLEKDDMINCERTNQGTRITVLNWSKYQENEDMGTSGGDSGVGNEPDSKGDSEGDTHEEGKEGEEEKEINGSDSDEQNDTSVLPKKYKGGESEKKAFELTEWLCKKIKELELKADVPMPSSKRYKKWMLAFCRIEEHDGFTWDEIKETLEWGFQDDFWSDQIRSATGLRNRGSNEQRKILNIYNAKKKNRNKIEKEWEEAD